MARTVEAPVNYTETSPREMVPLRQRDPRDGATRRGAAVRRAQRIAVRGNQDRFIAVAAAEKGVRLAEHIHRATDVEGLDALIDHDRDSLPARDLAVFCIATCLQDQPVNPLGESCLHP
jgi:hypothetical protein